MLISKLVAWQAMVQYAPTLQEYREIRNRSEALSREVRGIHVHPLQI